MFYIEPQLLQRMRFPNEKIPFHFMYFRQFFFIHFVFNNSAVTWTNWRSRNQKDVEATIKKTYFFFAIEGAHFQFSPRCSVSTAPYTVRLYSIFAEWSQYVVDFEMNRRHPYTHINIFSSSSRTTSNKRFDLQKRKFIGKSRQSQRRAEAGK